MPYFAYKARNAHGELLEGVLEGTDSGTVADQLLGNGATPIDISPTTRATTPINRKKWLERLKEGKVTALDVQLFSRQLHTLLKAGVPIMRALAGLQESAINKAFAKVLQDLRESLDSGRELSAALRRHPEVFSPFYLNMVRVGEATGRLDEVFLRLFQHLEAERQMREQVSSALRYPTFVVIAMLIAVTLINFLVIPRFAEVYRQFNSDLPLVTRVLIHTSDWALANWPYIAAGLIGLLLGFRHYISKPQGRYRWDRFKLHLPIAGSIVRKAALARFARSFAMASRSGVPIVQGMSVVAHTVDNTYIAERVEHMRDGVERGESILRTAVAAGVFTPIVLQMVAVGEETGELDNLMDEVGAMYEREVDYELKTLSAKLEPLLIVGLGIVVLILALGVFLPIWDLGKVALPK